MQNTAIGLLHRATSPMLLLVIPSSNCSKEGLTYYPLLVKITCVVAKWCQGISENIDFLLPLNQSFHDVVLRTLDKFILHFIYNRILTGHRPCDHKQIKCDQSAWYDRGDKGKTFGLVPEQAKNPHDKWGRKQYHDQQPSKGAYWIASARLNNEQSDQYSDRSNKKTSRSLSVSHLLSSKSYVTGYPDKPLLRVYLLWVEIARIILLLTQHTISVFSGIVYYRLAK